jgi:hypothetical protein
MSNVPEFDQLTACHVSPCPWGQGEREKINVNILE